MLSYLVVVWKGLPAWVQGGVEVLAFIVGAQIVKALHRREKWRTRIEFAAWFGVLLFVNRIWGVPGLLITIAFVGGLAVWHYGQRSDQTETQRRRRLMRAIEGYLHAEYERSYEGLPGAYPEDDPYRDFLKRYHGVYGDWELLDKYDEDGFTPEELDAMRVASRKWAATRAEERDAKKANVKAQPASET
jgi:hypothetical protein